MAWMGFRFYISTTIHGGIRIIRVNRFRSMYTLLYYYATDVELASATNERRKLTCSPQRLQMVQGNGQPRRWE